LTDSLLLVAGKVSLSKQGRHKPATLLGAARHNLREIEAELGPFGHIDRALIHRNEVLAGSASADGVVAYARALADVAGIDLSTLRRDYVQAVEFIFSLPATTTVDCTRYFRLCVDWLAERFGRDNVLSAVIHRDEAAPHTHVLVNPFIDGKRAGSKLIAAAPLKALLRDFSVDVAQPNGLHMSSKALKGTARHAASSQVLTHLQQGKDEVLRSALWPIIRSHIVARPEAYIAALGLTVPTSLSRAHRTKSMTDIFISKGAGSQRREEAC